MHQNNICMKLLQCKRLHKSSQKKKHMENTTIDNKIKIKQATLCNATCNHSTFKVEPLHNSKSIHENLIDKSIKYIRFWFNIEVWKKQLKIKAQHITFWLRALHKHLMSNMTSTILVLEWPTCLGTCTTVSSHVYKMITGLYSIKQFYAPGMSLPNLRHLILINHNMFSERVMMIILWLSYVKLNMRATKIMHHDQATHKNKLARFLKWK